MSGAGLIELLAARLGGRGARRAAPALREVLAAAIPERAPVAAYEPIAARLDDPMADGAMLSGADEIAPPMPNANRIGPDAGPVLGESSSGLVDIKLNDSRVPGGGPWRAITAPRDPASFNPANAWREGGFLPEANVGGYLQYDPTKWRVLETHLDNDLRGQGMGVRMYEDLIERARRARQPYIDSDSYVSPEAQRVYEALERRGYTVTRREGRNGPTFRVETERPARTAPDGGPVQAGRFSWDNDTFHLDSPQGQIRGRLWHDNITNENALKIDSSATLQEARGRGHGIALYVQAAEEAQRRSLPLVSDYRVSTDAANMYEALARRGYQVSRNPTATLTGKNWSAQDGSPVFRVENSTRTGPNAGSDHNALQRALRERMERE